MTKTMLVIDDNLRDSLEQVAENPAAYGLDCEIVQVETIAEAFKQLASWKERNMRCDILSCDADAGRGNGGVYDINTLYEKITGELGTEWLPKKSFFHSAIAFPGVPKTNYGKLEEYEAKEFKKLLDGQKTYVDDHSYPGETLRKYMNAAWGTQYAFSENEVIIMSADPDTKFSTTQTISGLDSGLIPNESEALRKLNLKNSSDFLDGQRLENAGFGILFSHYASGTIAGTVAFSAEKAALLKKQNPAEKIILFLESAGDYETIPDGIDGLVILKYDATAGHILELCNNMGIPALVGLAPKLMKYKKEGDKHIFTNMVDNVFTIEDGQGVSFDTGDEIDDILYGSLFDQNLGCEVMENDVDWNLPHILTLAQDIRHQNTTLQIKVNADSAKQIETAIELGAEGAGLVRSEHLFNTKEGKAFLTEAFVTGNPSGPSFKAMRLQQIEDFIPLLEAAKKSEKPFPVTIRLLDAPAPEFLSASDVEIFKKRVGAENMRGAQTGLRTKLLYDHQVLAIVEAFNQAQFPHPLKIMVPTVKTPAEMEEIRTIFNCYARGSGIELIPMIENRDALVHFSGRYGLQFSEMCIGTKDLTIDWMGGIMRHESAKIAAWTKANNVATSNPFISLIKPLRESLLDFRQSFVKSAGEGGEIPALAICGVQVAGDYHSINWAFENGFSLSVPARNVPYANLVAGQTIQGLEKVPS